MFAAIELTLNAWDLAAVFALCLLAVIVSRIIR